MMEVGYVAHYQRNLAQLLGPNNITEYPNTGVPVEPDMMTLLDKEAPFISEPTETVARMARLFRS